MQKKFTQRLALLTAITTSFTIVTPVFANDFSHHWANATINKWVNHDLSFENVVSTLTPNSVITRENLIDFICSALSIQDAKTLVHTFPMLYDGQGTLLNASSPATREDAAYVLATAYQLEMQPVINDSFLDTSRLSDWAIDSFIAMIDAGIIIGESPEQMNPEGSLTYAQLITMFDRLTASRFQTPGIYTTSVSGNALINTPGVILQDMTITGDLFITQGVAAGNTILDHVTVEGNIYIYGGGENSIHFTNDTYASSVIVDKWDDAIRIVLDDTSSIDSLSLHSGCILDGTFEKISIPQNLQLPAVQLSNHTRIKELVAYSPTVISGEGALENLILHTSDLAVDVAFDTIEFMSPDASIIIDNKSYTESNWNAFTQSITNTDTPDTGNPDTDNPDTGNPDTGNPDTSNPDTGNPDTGNPDTGNPDTGNPDTGNPDTGNPDTGNPGIQQVLH